MSVSAVGVGNNNVNFGSKRHRNEKTDYKRTDAFKIGYAIVGSGIGTGVGFLVKKLASPTDFLSGKILGQFKGDTFGHGSVAIIAGAFAALGLLIGALKDAAINKTVKNTVASVQQNEY